MVNFNLLRHRLVEICRRFDDDTGYARQSGGNSSSSDGGCADGGSHSRCGGFDAICLGHAIEESAFQVAQFHPHLLHLFQTQPINLGRPPSEDLFPDAVAPHEFLRYTHRVAVEELGKEVPQRRPVREGKESRLELVYESVGVRFLLGGPLPPAEGVGRLLFGGRSGCAVGHVGAGAAIGHGTAPHGGRRSGRGMMVVVVHGTVVRRRGNDRTVRVRPR